MINEYDKIKSSKERWCFVGKGEKKLGNSLWITDEISL